MKRKNYFIKNKILIGFVIITAAALLPVISYCVSKGKNDYQVVDNQIVVMFKEDISDSGLKNLVDKYDGSVRIEKHIDDYALFSVLDTKAFNKILTGLKADSQVLSAQADSKINSMSASKDTYSDTQWYIDNPGYYMNYSFGYRLQQECVAGMDMNVVKAWNSMTESKQAKREVVVALIDTGTDYSHKDLAGHMWKNKGEIPGDNKDNDGNGYVDDVYGWDFYNDDASTCHYNYIDKKKTASAKDDDDHGTHVAGIIAANANNKIGIAGVASNIDVKIMTLKINGGKKATGRMSDAIEAVKYATMMGADICNLSWGTTQYSESLYEAMKESDMLFVAAAGNAGKNNDAVPMYPANYRLDNLISVTAIDADGELTAFSNYGSNTVDIAAPGNNIYSTIIGGYATKSGSSMAVPQVTSIAALLYSCSNHIYAANVKDIIINNLKSIPELKGRVRYPGIPDAYKAILAAKNLVKDDTAPQLSFKTIYNKEDKQVQVFVKDFGHSHNRVIRWLYGKKSAKDFKRGTSGTLVENDKVILRNAGSYTFYASDYAGNETTEVYQVQEDKIAPKLKVSYTVSDNYKERTVTVLASDSQSGLNRVKYRNGVKKASDFLASEKGTKITMKGGEGTFKVKKDGTFTVFVSDHSGNMTVKVIKVKTVRITKLKFTETNKSMSVGDVFYMKTYIQPADSTDKIIYMSSNEQVAVVTYSGKVIALAEGTVTITAKSSSNITAVCIIKVKSDA